MRFEEVYDSWGTRRLTQEEAALILGVSSRTFRRYVNRYEEEGLAGLMEVAEKRGLFSNLYTDRGSHYWNTPEAGGKVDREYLTQFGEAMKRLGILMMPAYSPQARGRSERMFSTRQGRSLHSPAPGLAIP